MAKRLQPPLGVVLDDEKAERVRRSHDERIRELQRLPATSITVIGDVLLANGVETPVAHGLGRSPVFVKSSCPRNVATTGRVTEVRRDKYDRSKYIVLKASDWGATITVDVMVL